MSRATAKTAAPIAFENAPKDPLELWAKLLVGTSYRVPVEGRGSKPSTICTDVAGAVGFMHHNLASKVAGAVATNADDKAAARMVGNVFRLVAESVRNRRPPPLDLRRPADRHRLRIVIFDALVELVNPDRRRPWKELAKEAKMRRSCYAEAHRCATAVLSEKLSEGRTEFARRMFAP